LWRGRDWPDPKIGALGRPVPWAGGVHNNIRHPRVATIVCELGGLVHRLRVGSR
jgi:hypothetical protein